MKGDVTLATDVEAHFGRRFGSATTPAGMERQMHNAGDGVRGIVFGPPGPGEEGHFFNVVNQKGTVRFLDGQAGGAASPSGHKNFYLMRTN